MKIDAHHHFWSYNTEEYGWIDEAMRVIRRDFLPADLAATLKPERVDGVVSVQARQTVEETKWLLSLAAENSFIKGVIGWVPLAEKTVAGVLDELKASPKLKGVRHVVQGEPDPKFLEGTAFNAGLREVTARGLVYDILIFARQLPAAIAFVDRHPDQIFVLDHIAKPVVQGLPDPTWARNMRDLARRENVYCKFSGVVTEVPGWQWTPELLRPYFDVVAEAFGPARLMFGSDWPVCLVASEYARWIDFVEKCAAPLSAAERGRLLGGTAMEAYKL
ncbi:MAG: amidohydrolase family protein [Nibricoccus sp.]